jgi:hypothetical protein
VYLVFLEEFNPQDQKVEMKSNDNKAFVFMKGVKKGIINNGRLADVSLGTIADAT